MNGCRDAPKADPVIASGTTTQTDECSHLEALVSGIQELGGFVHPALKLQRPSPHYRGLFVSSPSDTEETIRIPAGETLIRIPEKLVLCGKNLPSRWHKKKGGDDNDDDAQDESDQQPSESMASPWLRCLAAYYAARSTASPSDSKSDVNDRQESVRRSYFDLLPARYDTVWEWTNEQEEFLAGCRAADEWKLDKKLLMERYRNQIVPFLVHCGIMAKQDESRLDEEAEYEVFKSACQCLMTRGFHLERTPPDGKVSSDPSQAKTSSETYQGPFLLPVIDMLNHASSADSTHCALLTRLPDDSFVVQATRDIEGGEEVLHSYGDTLTPSQFLQTFGFVPVSHMKRVAAGNSLSSPKATTPVVLTKLSVSEACWSVIESDVPQQVARSMRENGMIGDEVWDVSVDRSRHDVAAQGDILVLDPSNLMSDELVTAASLPFLPECVFQELGADKETLFDRSILDDYYLGTLVCKTLLGLVQSKLDSYTPIRWKGVERNDDSQLFQELLLEREKHRNDWALDASSQRLMYGLTLRLEEKSCLHALRQQVIDSLARLNDEGDDVQPVATDDQKNKRARQE